MVRTQTLVPRDRPNKNNRRAVMFTLKHRHANFQTNHEEQNHETKPQQPRSIHFTQYLGLISYITE